MRFAGKQWVYRFYRRELSGSLLAVSIVSGLLVTLLLVLVSPGIAVEKKNAPETVKILFAPAASESDRLNDPEPLFLPTSLNYSAKLNKKVDWSEQDSFLAFGGVYYVNYDKDLLDDGMARERSAGLRLLNEAVVSPLGENFSETFGQTSLETNYDGNSRLTIVVRSRKNGSIAETVSLPRIQFSPTKKLLEPLVIFCYGPAENRMFMIEHSSGDKAVDARIVEIMRERLRSRKTEEGGFTIETGF